MRSLRLAAIGLALVSSFSLASPAAPSEGVEYTVLAGPQPVEAAGKKVEVIEFFMYHCPHCNAFEPQLEQWVKQQGDKIVFRRIHMPYSGDNDPEAHLHLTLQAMGKAEALQGAAFQAFHTDPARMRTDPAILDWAAHNGIERTAFLGVWNSFGVMSRLHRATRVVQDYGVQFVPTLVVDGKYQTSPSTVQEALHATGEPELFQATLEVAGALVAKAARTK